MQRSSFGSGGVQPRVYIPRLTIGSIVSEQGFDPSSEDMQLRQSPAADLGKIYGMVNMSWRKQEREIVSTVSNLDMARVYLELPDKIEGLRILKAAIDRFLTAPGPTTPTQEGEE